MTEEISRRYALGGGALALAGLTAGRLTGLSGRSGSQLTRPVTSSGARAGAAAGPAGLLDAVSFGWEVSDIHNNGANVSFEVLTGIVLASTDFDVATMILGPPASPGFEEVLCQAAVSRGATPAYGAAPQVYLDQPQSADFGDLTIYNPSNLGIAADGYPFQDKFASVILKSWVPADGTGSSADRHVTATPGLVLNKGDYLTFHMDHAGVQVDVEMQITLTYGMQGPG